MWFLLLQFDSVCKLLQSEPLRPYRLITFYGYCVIQIYIKQLTSMLYMR